MLCLELLGVLESQLLDLRLAMRTFLPIYLRTLVASDMHILRREELRNLCKHILKEDHCLLLSGAEDFVSHAPSSPYIIRSSGTSELRICGKSSEHMAGKVDLRDDVDTLCGSIIDDLADLLLAEPAAFSVWSAVIYLALEKMAYESFLSYGSDFCELWIFLDLYSPSLVIGDMPVEGVQLVHLHDVKISLDHVHVEEMTHNVHVHSAVSETRSVIDFAAWKRPVKSGGFCFSEDFGRKHLLDRLYRVIESPE